MVIDNGVVLLLEDRLVVLVIVGLIITLVGVLPLRGDSIPGGRGLRAVPTGSVIAPLTLPVLPPSLLLNRPEVPRNLPTAPFRS